MPNITKARTITYDGEEVYVRTHIDVVDGLDKSMLLTPELIEKINDIDGSDIPDSLTNATPEKAGLMSAEDKRRLDELKTNSNPYNKTVSDSTTTASNTVIAADINKWPNNIQVVNLSKRVSECRNGIVLVWRSDATDDFYHYQYVPKNHVKTHSAAKIVHLIPTNSANEFCTKTVLIRDNVVTGTDDNHNRTTKANKVRLHEILEY
ncbi:hypothetical protein K0T65_000222 [Staphylococcus pseudintermedius]|nr:hypothetical protein [Staphylococcus pseudintermedius]